MFAAVSLAMRALSLNPTASALMGVNNSVVISFTFGLGSALAAAGGILYASLYPSIEPFMGVLPGLKAFVAAVLGGIGNIPGAALGGLIIGVTETLVAGYSKYAGIVLQYLGGILLIGGLVCLAVKAGKKQTGRAAVRGPLLTALTGGIVAAVGLLIGPAGIPSGYRDGVAFVILILILIFKPSGLLGKVEREKV